MLRSIKKKQGANERETRVSRISAATNQFVMSRRERRIQDTPLSAKGPPHHSWLGSPQEFECAQVLASMRRECSSKEPLDVTEL